MRFVRRRDRRRVVGALVATVVAAGAGLAAGGASADEVELMGSFEFAARADTLSIEVIDRSFPFVPAGQVMFLTPSTAQASATSVGGTSSWAGGPYAGDLFTVLLGTVNGLAAGALPPLPATLPGYVISNPIDPTPDPLELGPYHVSARSEPRRSIAESRLGVLSQDPSLLASHASAEVHVEDDGHVQLRAESRVSPFSLGSLVKVGEVRSVAAMRIDPDGEVAEQTTDSTIGVLSIAGLDVAFDEHGLRVLGIPLLPIDATGLLKLLEPLGISFEYMPKSVTETSVTSAGMRVSITQDVPTQGPVTVTLVLGAVTVAATTAYVADTGLPWDGDTGGSGGFDTSDGGGSFSGGSTGSSFTGGTGGSFGGSSGGSFVGGGGGTRTPSVAAPAGGRTPMAGGQPVASLRVGPDLLDLYLVFGLGALGAVGASRVIGVYAVRRPGR